MRYILIVLAGLLLSLGACSKKDLPEPVNGEPTIWLKGNIDGQPFDIKAGVNATYGSTITHDLDTIYREFVFTIDLQKSREKLRINLYDTFVNYNNIKDVLNYTIKPKSFNYTFSNQQSFYLNKNDVIVRYINYGWGLTYYSYQYAQNGSASFKILSVQDVEFEGKPYKLAEVQFNCKLRNPANGQVISIDNAHGFIPFGDDE